MNLFWFVIVNGAITLAQAYVWFQKTESSKIPDWCESAGYQFHNEYTGKLFAATKNIGSEKLIGKADMRGRGFFTKDGVVHYLDSYELLCAGLEDWVDKTTNIRNAVPAGIAEDGQSFYICRGKYKTNLLPGKYRKSIDCCFVQYANKEHCSRDYNILVQTS